MLFELLFWKRLWGLLDMAKEAEEKPSPFHTMNEHVWEMQECISRLAPIVHQHMLKAQTKQSLQLLCQALGDAVQ